MADRPYAEWHDGEYLIKRALVRVPTLAPNGLMVGRVKRKASWNYTALDVWMVGACADWIYSHTTPRRSVNDRYTSYFLKHVVERSTYGHQARRHHYVHNGAFIAAAIGLGYRWRSIDPLNCIFNVRLLPHLTREAICHRCGDR